MDDSTDLSSNCLDDTNEPKLTIESILSVWPTLESIAHSLSSGDIISLSRTSRSIRSITHAFEYSAPPPLNLGHHETSQWANLKSIAPFTCVSPTHKDPKSISSSSDHSRKSRQPIRPCNFCSRPICRTCIVRSFFADPTQSRNTFKHRTRHLCTTCWDTGNLRKDYRYPLHVSTSSREHIWEGRNYALRGQRCTCSASEDNWLCHPCRVLQNESGPHNISFFDLTSHDSGKNKGKQRDSSNADDSPGAQSPSRVEVPCYGLNCTRTISLSDPSRDRRRICLWCSRPLPRPFGGEDRYHWEAKNIAIRSANAASRSEDIAEWARNRFRTLTMSRRDMRGSEICSTFPGPEESHDQRLFVKHLDAVNYRAVMRESAVPTPEDVYKSKHGYWRYRLAFLTHRNFYERDKGHFAGKVWVEGDKEIQPPSSITADELFAVTSDGALPKARRNKDLPSRIEAVHEGGADTRNEKPRYAIVRLAVQLLDAGLMTEEEYLNLVAGRYEFPKKQQWEETLDTMYDQLMLVEISDENLAAREIVKTFGDVIQENGVVLDIKMKMNQEKPGEGCNLDTQSGPSKMTREDSSEATTPDEPEPSMILREGSEDASNQIAPDRDQISPGEEDSWEPAPPPGSPPAFSVAIDSSTSSR